MAFFTLVKKKVSLEETHFHLTVDRKCKVDALMLEILQTKLCVGREEVNIREQNLVE